MTGGDSRRIPLGRSPNAAFWENSGKFNGPVILPAYAHVVNGAGEAEQEARDKKNRDDNDTNPSPSFRLFRLTALIAREDNKEYWLGSGQVF